MHGYCATSQEEDDDEEVEVVTFKHTCSNCGVVIAEHYYQCTINLTKINYVMDCMLCGRGMEGERN